MKTAVILYPVLRHFEFVRRVIAGNPVRCHRGTAVGVGIYEALLRLRFVEGVFDSPVEDEEKNHNDCDLVSLHCFHLPSLGLCPRNRYSWNRRHRRRGSVVTASAPLHRWSSTCRSRRCRTSRSRSCGPTLGWPAVDRGCRGRSTRAPAGAWVLPQPLAAGDVIEFAATTVGGWTRWHGVIDAYEVDRWLTVQGPHPDAATAHDDAQRLLGLERFLPALDAEPRGADIGRCTRRPPTERPPPSVAGVPARESPGHASGSAPWLASWVHVRPGIDVRLRLEAQLPPHTSARTATQSAGTSDSGPWPIDRPRDL